MREISVVSPIDGSVIARRAIAGTAELDQRIDAARSAQREWRQAPIAERAAVCARFADAMAAMRDDIVPELARQMGRPVRYGAGEVRGLLERARMMVALAPEALADIEPAPISGFRRFIRREPLGVVFSVAAWNYPYLIAVNSVIPAILSGNSVLLKHSSQTPLCAERFAAAFERAGLPPGVFQVVHTDHAGAEHLVSHPGIDYVAFTGSVSGGQAIQRAARERFIATGLELGGKDPAYVRADADMDHAVENVVDGAYFNSGQSCCAVERIYVHRSRFEEFVERAAALVRDYRSGNPLDAETTLGPMVRGSAADGVRAQIAEALARGARPLIGPSDFPEDLPGSPYLAPQLLVDVDHSMQIMSEETFGPVVGVMPVDSDSEAVALMNDSRYGLTASIWSRDVEHSLQIADDLETGTVFLNRCDYLDPALAWVGVKDSGRGCTLSRVGFEQLTRPKSFHFRLPT